MKSGGTSRGIAHIVAVNMGYGHERPAHTLKHLSIDNEVIIANDYPGIPEADRALWEGSRKLYERVSRFKKVPVLGKFVFGIMDELQRIPAFYPRRDLSHPSLQLQEIYTLMRRRNWNRALIEKLAKNPVPMVCTFFTIAFAAEEFGYPGDIWAICTDADISRAWAPKDPKRSRIKYFAPNGRVKERLMLYGVREQNIELTGFPLPKDAIGEGEKSEVLQKTLSRRICNLDPNGIFLSRALKTLEAHMGPQYCENIKRETKIPVHLAFAVGGAGAQRETGVAIAKSLRNEIKRQRIRFTLIAGTRPEVNQYFVDELEKMGLKNELKKGKSLRILYHQNRPAYFDDFNKLISELDILWTKPSELSFYTGLGLPILMSETVGSQEDYNHKWIEQVGGGIDALDPRYTNEWLFDWIQSGALARMAWNGFIEAPTHGTFRMEDILLGRPNSIHALPLVV